MDARLTLSIIAAVADNGVIGRQGELPWKLSADLRRFKALTIGKTVIMGRKTFDSIVRRLGHPLPDRQSVVLTRDPAFHAAGCTVVDSLHEAIDAVRDRGEVFVLGGEQIYRLFLPFAERLYLTQVHAECKGDARFPDFSQFAWKEEAQERQEADDKNEFPFTFVTMQRGLLLRQPSDPNFGSFVYMPNARHDTQRAVMERILATGVCPFCPEHRDAGELGEILMRSGYWEARKNRWPYCNTRVHVLFIPHLHVESISELSLAATNDLMMLVSACEEEYGIKGGAFAIRTGNPALNGGTVHHLHAHLIAPLITDPADPKYEAIRFRMG